MNTIASMEGYGIYSFDEFEFENGEVLKDVKVEYSLHGTPKYDEEGNITNMILYFHGFNGNCSSFNDNYKLTSKGKVLSIEEYYFVSITALGLPDSCSPSNTGLKHKFPNYTIKDRVNFKRKFISENFKFKKILGLIGQGLGGYEIFTWACDYPDDMEFIIIASSSYKTNGYRYVVSKGIESIIESADRIYEVDGDYDDLFSHTLISISKVAYSNYFSKKIFQKMSNEEIDILMEDFANEALFNDIHDSKFRNNVILNYNVEDNLNQIKAKCLFISMTSDIYFTPEFDAEPLKKLIPNSKVVFIDSNPSDYFEFNYFEMAEDEIIDFLNEINKNDE